PELELRALHPLGQLLAVQAPKSGGVELGERRLARLLRRHAPLPLGGAKVVIAAQARAPQKRIRRATAGAAEPRLARLSQICGWGRLTAMSAGSPRGVWTRSSRLSDNARAHRPPPGSATGAPRLACARLARLGRGRGPARRAPRA